MMERIIDLALRQRVIVLVAAIGVLVGGIWGYTRLPVDAYPDVSPVLVQVFTETEGLAPEEVEQLVTFPVEVAMNGLPGIEEIRSVSNFGLSVVNIYFSRDTDVYFARQLVNERLQLARSELPEGLGEPAMGPIASGLGQILFYYLDADSGRYTAEELRTIQDWIVKRNLQTVDGVTEVLSIGGNVRQYQVVVDPQSLRQYDLTLNDVLEAVESNNLNVGASFLDVGSEEYIVRSVGLAHTEEDLRNISITARSGIPVRVGDVAEVELGPEIRRGLATRNGEEEVVVGFVLKLLGTNTSTVIGDVQSRLDQIRAIIPEDIRLVPYYQQAGLVDRATGTVTAALWQGLLLVILVLAIFLGHAKSSFIAALSLPFSVLFTFALMEILGIGANLMSLGGLAIGIGLMVDATIVVVENIHRWTTEEQPDGKRRLNRIDQIRMATREVGRPVLFAISIVVVVFLPLFTLEGVEGTMFRPLAYTISLAMLGSLIYSLTVAPALAAVLLADRPADGMFGRSMASVRKRLTNRAGSVPIEMDETEAPVVDAAPEGDSVWQKIGRIVPGIQERYGHFLEQVLARHRAVVAGTIGVILLGAAVFPFLGTEFIPTLNEGSLLIRATMAPSISLNESRQTVMRLERELLEFPEITQVISRVGRGEIGAHADPVNNAEMFVELLPQDEWTTASSQEELIAELEARLGGFPGAQLAFTQPIAAAVDELLTGTKAQIAIKLFGEDLDLLLSKANEIAAVVSGVEGASEVQVDQIIGQPQLRIELDRPALARYGISVSDAQATVRAAIGGTPAGQIFEGERRWTIFVRYAPEYRASAETIASLLIDAADGSRVPLGQVSRIETVVGPRQISRENNQRFVTVQLNARDRDIGSLVGEAREQIEERVELPPGYLLTFGGQFELAQAANRRLAVVVPITLLLIFGMLFMSLGSVRQALLILLNIPLALVGGIVALRITGQNLSVPSSVGFIALFGIAVESGLVLVSYFNQLREEGMSLEMAVRRGSVLRLRPVLMTALTTGLGLVPLLVASGAGSEVQRPLAIVVVGGLVTSTALTLIVLPALYSWLHQPRTA